MGGEALGQGDESGVTQMAEIHFALVGERRVGWRSEENVVGKQLHLGTVRVGDALVERHQNGVQLHVLQLVEQVDVGAQDQVDVELAAAQLQAHDQLWHGLHRQRVERTELKALGRETGRFAGTPHRLEHVLDQLLGTLLEYIGTFQRNQVAPLVLEQRASQRAFKRVDGAMHADVAGVQLDRGLAQIAAAHEGQKHFQLLQGQLFVDLHGRCSAVGQTIMPNSYSGGARKRSSAGDQGRASSSSSGISSVTYTRACSLWASSIRKPK